MSTGRVTPHFYANPKRDRQYDDVLREHLRATWKQPGRTYTQIARALELGNPSDDKAYGMAIMYALQDFVEKDDETICWYPNLRLKAADLQKKLAKSKHNHHALRLFKYAPSRKIIDRDPSRTDEIVKKVIIGFLKKHGQKSGNAIREAMTMKFGHVARSVVERCLSALIADGDVVKDVINPTLILYGLP